MSSVDSADGGWQPTSEADRQQVRDQLTRILASAHFLSSRRYPNLLRFVVEKTLEGQDDSLKERLLGIEVFHRAPDYDTNQDPVVRLSAAEVRKRIALYYQHPAHQNELLIGLNPGSYIPTFRPPQVVSAESAPAIPEPAAVNETKAAYSSERLRTPVLVALTSVAAIALGVWLYSRPSPIEQFWAPVLNSPSRVTLCVGSPDAVNAAHQNAPTPSTVLDDLSHSGRLGTANVAALIHMGGILESRHKVFRLELASQTSFPELHEGPVLLVGALDNAWTMRLTQSLRYGFAMNSEAMYIADRKNPSTRNWSVSLKQAPASQVEDFAIVARYSDSTLDQPVVLVAGLSREGTEAAGELVSNPGFLKTLFARSPRNPKNVNLEAVLQIQVIDGHPGPAHIVAVEYW